MELTPVEMAVIHMLRVIVDSNKIKYTADAITQTVRAGVNPEFIFN